MKKVTILIAVICSLVLASPSAAQINEEVKGSFEKSGLVPDVLDAAPREAVLVWFGDNEVNLGNELTPTQVHNKPVLFWNTKKDTFYTLSFIDLDSPNRKSHENREKNHWLVGNIPGDDISAGEEIVEFIGSNPLTNSGFHRYTFLVYEQNKKLKFDEKRITTSTDEGRAKFSNRKFAAKYNLGNPFAGNFYIAQHEN